jgi:hypothetical protein
MQVSFREGPLKIRNGGMSSPDTLQQASKVVNVPRSLTFNFWTRREPFTTIILSLVCGAVERPVSSAL